MTNRDRDLAPRCDGLCVTSADAGVPGDGIAQAHPGCPLHNPERFYPSVEGADLRLRCWSCETVWDEDDLQQIQPDGRYACPFEACGVDTLELAHSGQATAMPVRPIGPADRDVQ